MGKNCREISRLMILPNFFSPRNSSVVDHMIIHVASELEDPTADSILPLLHWSM